MSMDDIVEELIEKGHKKGHEEGRLLQARAAVRRIVALRKLTLRPADEARIDACTDLATLDRWLEQATAAQSVAEALAPPAAVTPARRRRSARSS